MSIFPQNTSFMMENEVAQREDRNTSEEGGDENDNWQLNMPHRWCCSNTNNCGIAMDDDGLTLYTSYTHRPNSSRYEKFVCVVADKPFPMHALLKLDSNKTENYAQDLDEEVGWDRVDPDDESSLLLNIPEQHRRTQKYFYFEITIASGVACIGLQPAESIVGHSEEDSDFSQNNHPVIFDKIPGKIPNSIGFLSDGQIHVSGTSTTLKENKEHELDEEEVWEVIGCGWQIGGINEVFFTKNGEIIEPKDPIDTSLSMNVMFPVVSLQTDGTTIVANFGEKSFAYTGNSDIELITIQSTFEPTKSPIAHIVRPVEGTFDMQEVVCEVKANEPKHNNSLAWDQDSRFGQTPQARNDLRIITKDEIEDFKVYARQLRNLTSEHDPDVISSMEEMVRIALQKVQHAINSNKVVDFVVLFDLNELLIDALNAASKRNRKVPPTILQSTNSTNNDDAAISSDNIITEPAVHENEVPSLVRNKDIFSLICMLRSHTGDRLEAAIALMGLAKDEGLAADGGSKLRDEIRSSGGMHSLLTLFKSSKDASEMKLATALAVAYLIPSLTDPTHCQGDMGLRVMECLRYLVNSPKIPTSSKISSREVREVAGLALTHLWINVLQPTWSEKKMLNEYGSVPFRPDLSSVLSHEAVKKAPSTKPSRLVGRWGRLQQRQEMTEMQELLETTVSLVVTVADSEIDDWTDSKGQEKNAAQNLRYNAAVTVESLCAVEFARPIAVREGLLKVLVRWLSSNNVELERPAANALRNLTSLHDEYMAGWIHSQIVNEGALPAIVKLSVSSQHDIRLAVAQILSSLSVAPHTRAAIVDAKGLNYLVQLVVYSVHELPADKIDEPLALAAGSALLRIAAGAMSHSSGWMRPNLEISEAREERNDVIRDILEGGALDPFVAMARSEHRGNLRIMSVEAIHIISEDIRIRQWTRQKLCDTGAAFACGIVLKQGVPVLYSMLQPTKSKMSTGSKSEDSLDKLQSERAPLLELYHALLALANMLEPSTQQEEEALSLVVKFGDQDFKPSRFQDTLVKACMQTAESGGVESLLWMASLPVATAHFPQSSYTKTVDPNELLVESYRSLALLCPLLLSATSASKGFAKWAGHVLLALTGVLKREVIIDQGERVEMVRELQLDALRGLCSLAEYEPLKVMIIDECLPQLLQFKNDRGVINELSHLANQVCLALGFSEEEMDVQLAGNDPKLLADWFCLERSLIVQAMARDEIRLALFRAWGPVLRKIHELHMSSEPGVKMADATFMPITTSSQNLVEDTLGNALLKSENLMETLFSEANISSASMSDSSHADTFAYLRVIFENLADDEDSASLRNLLLQQYGNIYETDRENDASTVGSIYDDESSCNDSFFPLPFRGTSLNTSNAIVSPGFAEMGDDGETDTTASEKPTTGRSIYSRSPSVKVYDDPRRERIGVLGAHPFPIQNIIVEKDWIMAHRRSLAEFGSGTDSIWNEPYTHSFVPLPIRVQSLLDLYFPSSLLQSEILPLNDLIPDASFNFRALAMPERRYFSFRREGQILSRIYEKYASSIDLDDVHWTLGFSNGSFAGEFAETLVQALYRCPVIQSISFSRNRPYTTSFKRSTSNNSHHHKDEEEDDGSTLLAYLAGSLPPWVTCLTFDNVLKKNAILALVNILETMGQRSAGNNGPQINGRKHNRDIDPDPEGAASLGSQGYGIFHGLAIRNSPQLADDALLPFFRLLGYRNSPPRVNLNRPPLLSLRVLDLSGNNLGDSCSANLLNIVHSASSQCSLEKLDLSGNDIREGVAVVQVFRDYVQKYRQPQGSGAAGYNKWCSPLVTLNLDSNSLNCGTAPQDIISMLENNVLGLQSLTLENNELDGGGDSFLDTLTSSLLHNTTLLDLNLSENCFGTSFIDTFLKGIQDGRTCTTFLHFDGNIPEITEAQTLALNDHTIRIKRERVFSYFDKKQKRTNMNLEEKHSINNDDLNIESFSNSLSQNRSEKTSSNSTENLEDMIYSDSFITEQGFDDMSSNVNSETTLKLPYRTRIKKASQIEYKSGTRSSDVDSLSYRNSSSSIGNKITVLFSAPLVWKDTQDMLRPIEMLDFELERELLWQCFKEASMDIELSFDNATADRLQATMTKCCGCLHYSGHGNPNFLTFEDGKGGLHWLEVNQLKDLISNGVKGGGAPFKFVFVSACHSGLAGETFVNAGVPHVVCCKQESQLMDSAALAFTRAFYLALAIGRTVKDSFEIGRQAVAVAPSVPDSDQEMKKFVLLPKNGKHDVPIFDAESIPEWPPPSMASGSGRRFKYERKTDNDILEQALPTPPQGFLGREVEMYILMNEVLTKRFVSLVGITGIGRSSLASAMCHYINDRKSTMIAIETIIYVRARPSRGGDRYGSFITPLHKQLVAAGKATTLEEGSDLDDKFHSIFNALSKTKALIVFDRAEILEGSVEAQEFPLFLSSLFRETRNVRVLMTAGKPFGLSSLRGVGEHIVQLGPLNFKSTVRLFAILCPHVHTVYERRRLLELLVPDKEAHMCVSDKGISERCKSIFKIVGNGIPARTFDVAYAMSKEDYHDLLQIGQNNEEEM